MFMCILFIAVDQHPRFPLIIAANRDERHARPSAPMHFWRDRPEVLAGRDRAGGGAWFGVNTRGRIAAVTNHRGLREHRGARSRGRLVARFLSGSDTRDEFEKFLQLEHRAYNPFHLIYGDAKSLHCFSSAEARVRILARGFHSIGNGSFHDAWPKMSRGVALLRRQIADDNVAAESLVRIMKDQTPPRKKSRGKTHDKNRSAIFIRGASFGTRATTLLLAAHNEFAICEHTFAPGGIHRGRAHFSLRIAQNKTQN